MSEQSKTLEVNITLMVYYSRIIPIDFNKNDNVFFCYLYRCTNNFITRKYEKKSHII